MALINKKLTELTEKLSVPDDAFIHIVDTSDTSQSPEGSSYKAKKSTISGTVKAQSGVSGTVKTNSNSVDPIVYLKSEVDTLIVGKQNSLGFTAENVANKQNNLDADITNAKYPTVTAVNNGLSVKADATALALKADKTSTYTKGETDNIIASVEIDVANKENTANKQNSLLFDGTGVKFPTVDAVNNALPSVYSNIVYVNSTSPTTATIFDTANPPITNNNALKINTSNLYIGTDASTWVYITSPAGYITKIVSPSSNFNILGTNIDAGNNKVSAISRSGSLRIDNDITLSTNLRSSTANLMLFDFNGIIFRSLRSNAWSDNLSSRFFQIGTTGDNVVFSTQSANNANRMMFASNATQFNSGNYLTTPSPIGVFEITNGTSRILNAFSNGNITIGTSPTTSAGTYDFLSRNTSTGVIEKIPSTNLSLTGVPTAPTATLGTNTTQIATTAFVNNANNENVKLTGFQEITGLKSFKPATNVTGVQVVPTSGSSPSFFADLATNSTAYSGFLANNNGTGLSYVGQNNGVTNFSVNKFGVVIGSIFRLKNYTVATLPTGVEGDTAYVTDATAPTYLGPLIGGGSVKAPVFFNGTAWVSH